MLFRLKGRNQARSVDHVPVDRYGTVGLNPAVGFLPAEKGEAIHIDRGRQRDLLAVVNRLDDILSAVDLKTHFTNLPVRHFGEIRFWCPDQHDNHGKERQLENHQRPDQPA